MFYVKWEEQELWRNFVCVLAGIDTTVIGLFFH